MACSRRNVRNYPTDFSANVLFGVANSLVNHRKYSVIKEAVGLGLVSTGNVPNNSEGRHYNQFILTRAELN